MSEPEDVRAQLDRIEGLGRDTVKLLMGLMLSNSLASGIVGTGGGGAGGSAGPGGAAGGGGGNAGGDGGSGGIAVSLTQVQMDPPAELLEWLRGLQPELAADLESQNPVDRFHGWQRFRTWLIAQSM